MLAIVAVTGCGGDEPAAEELDLPGASGSGPSSSPSPSGGAAGGEQDLPPGVPTDPPLAPTGLEDDDAGAEAYAEYVFRMFQFHTARRDLGPVEDLGRCPSCASITENHQEMAREGVYDVPDESPEPGITSKIGMIGEDRDITLMGVSYDLSAGKTIDEQGEVVGTLRAAEKKYMEIAIRRGNGTWRLVDVAITD